FSAAKCAKGEIVGRGKKGDNQKRAQDTCVVRQTEQIVTHRKRMVLLGSVHIVKPGPSAQVNHLADYRVQDAEDSRPDAEVPAQVVRHRILLPSKQVPGTH